MFGQPKDWRTQRINSRFITRFGIEKNPQGSTLRKIGRIAKTHRSKRSLGVRAEAQLRNLRGALPQWMSNIKCAPANRDTRGPKWKKYVATPEERRCHRDQHTVVQPNPRGGGHAVKTKEHVEYGLPQWKMGKLDLSFSRSRCRTAIGHHQHGHLSARSFLWDYSPSSHSGDSHHNFPHLTSQHKSCTVEHVLQEHKHRATWCCETQVSESNDFCVILSSNRQSKNDTSNGKSTQIPTPTRTFFSVLAFRHILTHCAHPHHFYGQGQIVKIIPSSQPC